MLFSTAAAAFYFPAKNVHRFRFLLRNQTFNCISILIFMATGSFTGERRLGE